MTEIIKYCYDGSKRKCWVGDEELTKLSDNGWKVVFQHQQATLTIETVAISNNLSITLRNVKETLPTIHDPDNVDYGNVIWDEELQDYKLVKGLPKMFHLYVENYNQNNPLLFYFHAKAHLVDKDRDKNKPWFYYKWDWCLPLGQYIYNTLSPHIKKGQGEIVILPADETWSVVHPWINNGYLENNDYYYTYENQDLNDNDYDFFTETEKNWKKYNLDEPKLIISFNPTYFKNYELEKKYKLTGTKWLKKLNEVFPNIPLVLKCYSGFIYNQLYFHHRELFNKISAITVLPTSISGRETGNSDQLVFFNCHFLGDGIGSKLPWNLVIDGHLVKGDHTIFYRNE